jgi:hypothetical protein
MREKLWKALPYALGALSLLFLLYAASVLSRSIGLFKDELWDFTPAVQMLHGDYVIATQQMWILGIPVHLVTGPYMGALKSWVLAPLLMLLGTTPSLLLTLNVAFSILHLAALYWALIPAVGKKWACLVFAAPLMDTNFLLTAPMDAGPNLFQYLFLNLALGATLRYLAGSQPRHYWLAGFFSGCVLAQKLTSAPLVLGFAVILLLLAARDFRTRMRTHGAGSALVIFLAIPAAAFLIPLIPHLTYLFRSGLGDLFSMQATGPRPPFLTVLGDNFSYFRAMFDGIDWYRRIALDSRPMATPFPIWSTLGLVLMAFALALAFRNGKKGKHFASICIGLFIAGFLLFPFFKELNRPWHLYALTPIFTAAWVAAFVQIFDRFASRSGRWRLGAHTAGFILLAACVAPGIIHGLGMLRRIDAYKGMSITSPAIYDVYQAMQRQNLQEIHAVNYSLDTPIYVLSKGSIRVEDLTWTELTAAKIEELLGKIQANPQSGILYRYCGSREWDPEWMKWLNRETEIQRLNAMAERLHPQIQIVRCADKRQTEFVLISHKSH